MKLNRLISIIMILLDYDKISANELAKMLEVTKRTIYRDIEAINMAGIPIVTYPGVNGGISIMESYKFDKKLFTPKDIVNILSGLGNISGVLQEKEINNTITKLKSYISENDLQSLELKSNQIVIDFSTWRRNQKILHRLDKVKRAIQDSLIIEYDYSDKSGEKSKRVVEPYQLILRGSSWYLHAYCLLRKGFRIFKLSRMNDVIFRDENFDSREFNTKPLDEMAWIKDKLIDFKCIINNSIKEQFYEEVEILSEEKINKKQTLVTFPYTADEYGYRVLLGWADKCRCVAPDFVADELNERIKKMYKLYNS